MPARRWSIRSTLKIATPPLLIPSKIPFYYHFKKFDNISKVITVFANLTIFRFGTNGRDSPAEGGSDGSGKDNNEVRQSPRCEAFVMTGEKILRWVVTWVFLIKKIYIYSISIKDVIFLQRMV